MLWAPKMAPMTGRLSADSTVIFGTLSLPLVCRLLGLLLHTLDAILGGLDGQMVSGGETVQPFWHQMGAIWVTSGPTGAILGIILAIGIAELARSWPGQQPLASRSLHGAGRVNSHWWDLSPLPPCVVCHSGTPCRQALVTR